MDKYRSSGNLLHSFSKNSNKKHQNFLKKSRFIQTKYGNISDYENENEEQENYLNNIDKDERGILIDDDFFYEEPPVTETKDAYGDGGLEYDMAFFSEEDLKNNTAPQKKLDGKLVSDFCEAYYQEK